MALTASDDRWRELEVDECLALLRASRVGRLALVEGELPLILPVNYVRDGDAAAATGRRINAAEIPANWWG